VCVAIRLIVIPKPGADILQWSNLNGVILVLYVCDGDVGEYPDKIFQVVSVQSGSPIVKPTVDGHEHSNGASAIVVRRVVDPGSKIKVVDYANRFTGLGGDVMSPFSYYFTDHVG